MTAELDLHFQSPDGPVLVARLRSQVGGRVAILVAEPRYAADVERLLGQGVASDTLRRRVRPEEGQPFLEAVAEVLRGSTYWSVVPARPG